MTVLQGLGATIAKGDGASPEQFTVIGQITKIDGLGWSANSVETTTLSSAWRTFLQTIKDGGTVSLGFQYDPSDTSQTGPRDMATGNANFRVALTDSPPEKWTFAAGTNKFMIDSITPEGIITGTIDLKVSGAHTIA